MGFQSEFIVSGDGLGNSDATKSFQEAIDAAIQTAVDHLVASGQKDNPTFFVPNVIVPPGLWKITAPLHLTQYRVVSNNTHAMSVRLIGRSETGWNTDLHKGAVLDFSGMPTRPAVIAGEGSAIVGLTIRRFADFVDIVSNCGPTILLDGHGVTIRHAEIENSWIGVGSNDAVTIEFLFLADKRQRFFLSAKNGRPLILPVNLDEVDDLRRTNNALHWRVECRENLKDLLELYAKKVDGAYTIQFLGEDVDYGKFLDLDGSTGELVLSRGSGAVSSTYPTGIFWELLRSRDADTNETFARNVGDSAYQFRFLDFDLKRQPVLTEEHTAFPILPLSPSHDHSALKDLKDTVAYRCAQDFRPPKGGKLAIENVVEVNGFNIEDVRVLNARRYGFFLAGASDTSYLRRSDVRNSHYDTPISDGHEVLRDTAVGFYFGRLDTVFIQQIHVIGAAIGVICTRSESDMSLRSGPWGSISGFHFDATGCAMLIQGGQLAVTGIAGNGGKWGFLINARRSVEATARHSDPSRQTDVSNTMYRVDDAPIVAIAGGNIQVERAVESKAAFRVVVSGLTSMGEIVINAAHTPYCNVDAVVLNADITQPQWEQ